MTNSRRLIVFTALVAVFTTTVMSQGQPTKVVIQDPDLAAWMVTNNTFIEDITPYTDPANQFWEGILIQVGDYQGASGVFESLEFLKGNSVKKTLKKGEFLWIDIRPAKSSKQEPMNKQHVGLLLPDSSTKTLCDAIDQCALNNCDPDEQVTRCLRRRSLHSDFTPWAIITIWFDSSPVEISIGDPGPPGIRHKRTSHVPTQQTFTLKGELSVSIFNVGDSKPTEFTEMWTELRINVKDTPNHGSHHDPGWPTGK